MEGREGLSYAIIQYSPSCVWDVAIGAVYFHSGTAVLLGPADASDGGICITENCVIRGNWTQDIGSNKNARRHLLCQSNHKTQIIWKGWESLLCYSPTDPNDKNQLNVLMATRNIIEMVWMNRDSKIWKRSMNKHLKWFNGRKKLMVPQIWNKTTQSYWIIWIYRTLWSQ
jgi:hypothetical protein